jgi:hypothetical protein
MATANDFRTLSPLDFEELVRDLLQAQWGVTLESFGAGADQRGSTCAISRALTRSSSRRSILVKVAMRALKRTYATSA